MSRIAVRLRGEVSEFQQVFVDFAERPPFIYFNEEDHTPEVDITVADTPAEVDKWFRDPVIALIDLGHGRVLRQQISSAQEESYDLVLECSELLQFVTSEPEHRPLGSWHWND